MKRQTSVTFWQSGWQALSLVLGATVGLIACSDVRLRPLGGTLSNVQGKGELCITEPEEVKRWMKFLFVIDKSGSNSDTDPNAEKRAGNIERFLRSNIAATNNQYSMIQFSGETATAYINEGCEDCPTFSADLNVALTAANRLRTEGDGGSTPYKAALQLAQTAIRNDIDKNPEEESFYMVFFISDGEPTDIANDGELDALVRGLTAIDEKNIALSTGFYGGNGNEAERRLERMATIGNGKFIDFERNANWDFNDLIVKPTFEPWQLKYELMIYNVNAGFCEDGSIDLDSDGDGMCDKDEARYPGFNPAKRFSFNDGYGDYFHWRRVKYRETLPPCLSRDDQDRDFLTTCEEAYIRNDRPSEDVPRNGDPKNPDTDRDGVIDGIETFVYMARTMAFAMDSFNLQENFDGEEPARRQIGQHRNPLIRDPNQPAYDINLSPILDRQVDCYGFRQSVLPLYNTLEVKAGDTLPGLEHRALENVISVHYIQTRQSDPKGDGIYRYSLQKLMNDEPTRRLIGSSQALRFDDRSFKSYKYGTRGR
ncbi:MAG: VWA domain-containing protein [Bdellovibrionales bacterium]